MGPDVGSAQLLDRLARPQIPALGRRWQAYQTCGATGLALAVTLASALAVRLGLSATVLAVLAAAGVATFFALAEVTRIAAGRPLIINYHHEIAVVGVAALVLHLLGRPILPYLDLTVLGLGVFVACGRVGCFLVGCCHGRPHGWGVCYGARHAEEGFPAYLVGVRLVPVQLLEAAWVAAIVAVDVAALAGGAAPGATFAWHTVAYGLGRFAFEQLRGDTGRRFAGPCSEAQWTALATLAAIALAERAGLLPLRPWHAGAALALAGAVLALAARGEARRLLHPLHAREIAELLAAARARSVPGGPLHLGETSLGLRLSVSAVAPAAPAAPPALRAPTAAGGGVDLVAFSRPRRALPASSARRLSRLISRLCGDGTPAPPAEVFACGSGVTHLVLPRRSAHAL
jgi:Prolipoprotein diacylglyceryl transferase